ncbi:MAG: hypothetical protein U0169_02540 [Polyangiaceae bacterium]
MKTLCPGLPALLRNPPTAIRTSTELLNLANGGYYRLANDLDLTGLERTTPPSTNTENVVLDGAGHTIRGWSSSRAILGTVVCAVVSDVAVEHPVLRGAAPSSEAGLVMGRGALVDRLYKGVLAGIRVTDVDVDVSGTNSVGGIAGFVTQSRVSGSSVLGGAIATGDRLSQGNFTGGLVGSAAEDVRMKGVSSTASVTAAGYVGGIVGACRSGSDRTSLDSATFDGTLVVTDTVLSRAGGIVGSGRVDVSASRTSGTIHPAAGAARVTDFGGIGGYLSGTLADDSSTMSLEFAPLTGQGNAFGGIVGTLDGVVLRGRYRGTIRGAQSVGGIAGDAFAAHVKASVVESGTVLDGYVVGGIVGRPSFLSLGTFSHTETRVEDCHAHGTFTALTAIPAPGGVGGIVGANYFVSPQDDPLVVTNSYSDATLGGPRDRGGIVAAYQTATVTVTNAYFDSAAAGTSASAGGGTAVTAAQLRDVTTFTGFDFTSTWAPPNGAPPKLTWE